MEKAKKNLSFLWTILAIAMPVAGQRLIDIAVNMADTLMLGNYGDITLSASSLANQFYNMFSIFCMGLSGGCCVLASQYWGAKNLHAYKSVLNLSVRTCVAGSTVFALLSAFFPEQIMAFYSSNSEVVRQGTEYLRLLTAVFFFHGITTCLANLLRSVGLSWLPLIGSCISLVVNIILNWVFIFGKLGFPEMRIAGAALGTLIARAIEFGVILGYLLYKDKVISLHFRDLFAPVQRQQYRMYFKVGLPVLISDMLIGVGNNLVAMVIGNLGAEISAANSICTMVVQMNTVVNLGFALAGSITVGQTIGRGELQRAKKMGKAFLGASALLGVLAGFLTVWITPWLIGFYQVSSQTYAYAYELMYSFALILPFQTIGTVLAKGILRGGGDTRFLMFADVAFLWIASVPLGYLAAFTWHLSPFWIQLLLRIDVVMKSIVCCLRLYLGQWVHHLSSACKKSLTE